MKIALSIAGGLACGVVIGGAGVVWYFAKGMWRNM